MKILIYLLFLTCLGFAQTQTLEGIWEGIIQTPQGKLEIIVHFDLVEPWQGTIDIPQQNSYDLPLENIVFQANEVSFSIRDVFGQPTFKGKLENETLQGEFIQSGQAMAFVLNRKKELSAEEKESILEQGRNLTQQFYNRELDTLSKQFSVAMAQALNKTDLSAFGEQIEDQLGQESQVIDEQVSRSQDLYIYRRITRFEKLEQNIIVQWTLNAQHEVDGFWITPDTTSEAPSNYLEYQTKTTLRLPFEGEWLVVWGGRTVAENYHAAYSHMRFAYDLLIVKDGSSFSREGTKNTDYYCFGQAILAPGDGIISSLLDGLPDQLPGTMDPSTATGNHIVIDHHNGEFSLLAHLQENSIVVRQGDHIQAGDVLAKCGNSGNTTEPHLHYQLQTSPIFGQGESLPAQFQNYLADDKHIPRGEPNQNQSVMQE